MVFEGMIEPRVCEFGSEACLGDVNQGGSNFGRFIMVQSHFSTRALGIQTCRWHLVMSQDLPLGLLRAWSEMSLCGAPVASQLSRHPRLRSKTMVRRYEQKNPMEMRFGLVLGR